MWHCASLFPLCARTHPHCRHHHLLHTRARRLAAERALQASLWDRRILDTLGTFVDNHDVPRFLEVNADVQLFKNALAYVLLAQVCTARSASRPSAALRAVLAQACLQSLSLLRCCAARALCTSPQAAPVDAGWLKAPPTVPAPPPQHCVQHYCVQHCNTVCNTAVCRASL